MADDDSTTTDTAPPATDDAPPAPDGDWQDRFKAQQKVNRDLERKFKEAQSRLQEVDDRDKTETQKLTERAETAERRAAEVEARTLRAEVALTKGLTPTQAKRLVGTTEAELLADADVLLADLKAANPRGAVDQGVRGEPATGKPGMNDLIRAASGRS